MTTRRKLVLLVSGFDQPGRDCAAVSLGMMSLQGDRLFDVYYAIGDASTFEYDRSKNIHQGQSGGLFSAHGSTLIGGRHQQAIARALAQFETTVINMGGTPALHGLLRAGASSFITGAASLLHLLEQAATQLGASVPENIVAVQTANLPGVLHYGIAQYAFPEAMTRNAWMLPLESSPETINRLMQLGVKTVWTVASADADCSAWQQGGLTLKSADVLQPDETYLSFTFRIAERHQAQGFDLCEPVLASYWLPYSLMNRRWQVCGEAMIDAAERLAPLVSAVGDHVVYGRYAGGPICGARDDEDLFPLFRNDIPFEVIEPNRPVLKVFDQQPSAFAQLQASPFDLEPPDEQLRAWATKGMILTTLVFHSGELSHDDANYHIMELAGLTRVRIGLPMHVQRYTFDPDCVEPMQLPVEQGGVLGLCEPLLHSAGFGIHAEGLGTPEKVGRLAAQAREAIVQRVGEANAPRGIYCYLDAAPPDWKTSPVELWQALQAAGFEYVISSVKNGVSRLLYRDGDFVVLNQNSYNYYPYSPFVRLNSVEQMAAIEREYCRQSQPGWMLTVLDTPIFAYSTYLVKGKSRPMEAHPMLYDHAKLGDFFEYISTRGEMSKVVSATPHTIARYARLLDDMNLIERG